MKVNKKNEKIRYNFIKKITYYKSLAKKFKNRIILLKNPKIKERFKYQNDVNFLSMKTDVELKENLVLFKKKITRSYTTDHAFGKNVFLKKTIKNLKNLKNKQQISFKNLSAKRSMKEFRFSLKPLFLKRSKFSRLKKKKTFF